MKKRWPKDGSTVQFSELTAPVRTAIEFAYRIERKHKNRTIPWDGYSVGSDVLVCDFAPDEKLRAKNLKFDLEDQGRDALDVIIAIAVQLGLEQGKRNYLKSTKYELKEMRHEMEIAGLKKEIVNLGKAIACSRDANK